MYPFKPIELHVHTNKVKMALGNLDGPDDADDAQWS